MRTALLLSKYPVYRSGIKLLLLYEMNLHVVETEGRQETLDYIRQNPVDIAIMDIDISSSQDEELLRTINSTAPALPILVLTPLLEQKHPQTIFQVGVAGVLSPRSTKEEFIAAVRSTLEQTAPTTYPP